MQDRNSEAAKGINIMGFFDSVSSGAEIFKFRNVGDGIAGRVTGTEERQATDFTTKEPKFYPSGDPIMELWVTLETTPGDASSAQTVIIGGKLIKQAVAKAIRTAGKSDVSAGDDLAVTFTGFAGRAKVYAAAYSPAAAE